MLRKKIAPVWAYYTNINESKRTAECKICFRALSYKTTTSNLNAHLKQKHLEVFEAMPKRPLNASSNACDDDSTEVENSEEEDEDSPKPGGSVWSYFEKAGNYARCAVCHSRVPRLNVAMRAHLRDHHPKLLPAAESDQDQDGEGEHFTEVIYLEDTPGGNEERKQKRKRIEYSEPTPTKRSPPPQREKPSRKESTKKTPGEEEIESFGAYITCLLKSLPKDVCTAVQRDIVNIIMTAKLQKPQIDTPVVLKPNKYIVIENGEETNGGKDEGKVYSSYTIKVDSGNVVGSVGPDKTVLNDGGSIENID